MNNLDIEISAEQATMRQGILMIRDKGFQVPEIPPLIFY